MPYHITVICCDCDAEISEEGYDDLPSDLHDRCEECEEKCRDEDERQYWIAKGLA